ncbi:MAG: hypothetical protein PHF86_05270 [Candidatus Nanoarchaeia archaeon]|jgi:hypothetical protein|nr:hypothetical protein [Candidatus Nanoarchaeia archaeon]
MNCPIKDCVLHKDCEILEIIRKAPKNAASCSYFKSQAQVDKKKRKQEKHAADLEAAKKRKKK